MCQVVVAPLSGTGHAGGDPGNDPDPACPKEEHSGPGIKGEKALG